MLNEYIEVGHMIILTQGAQRICAYHIVDIVIFVYMKWNGDYLGHSNN